MRISKRGPEDERSDSLAKLGRRLVARPYARRGVAMSTETIRVILADDHAMVREGLRLLLSATPDISVIGEAEDGAGALSLARRLEPELVVLDLDMPGVDVRVALRTFAEELPSVRVLILTVYAEQEHLLPLLEAGARGYLTKEAASRELVEAIRVVAGGEIYVRPKVARLLATAVVTRDAAETARGRFEALSDREQSIVILVARGYSGTEAARQLGISTKTVAEYKRRVQEKLGLEHRTEYVQFAIEAEILV